MIAYACEEVFRPEPRPDMRVCIPEDVDEAYSRFEHDPVFHTTLLVASGGVVWMHCSVERVLEKWSSTIHSSGWSECLLSNHFSDVYSVT